MKNGMSKAALRHVTKTEWKLPAFMVEFAFSVMKGQKGTDAKARLKIELLKRNDDLVAALDDAEADAEAIRAAIREVESVLNV